MSAPREDDLAELEAQARRNLADAVAELAGVLVMKIQAGQTPPRRAAVTSGSSGRTSRSATFRN